jgi:hypothetical protein
MLDAAAKQDVPLVVYWQTYDNEMKDGKHRGFWLRRPDGSCSWSYNYFKSLLMPRVLVDA